MTSTTENQDTTPPADEATPEGPGISRGYFLFAGVLGASFVLIVLVLSVIIGAQKVIEYFEYPGSSGNGASVDSGDGGGDAVASGEEVFNSTCTACHGADGTGIEGLGPDLHGNEFAAGLSDDELVDFLEVGRAIDSPDNTSGVAMPPKGGNPSLTEDDLADVVAYLRTLE